MSSSASALTGYGFVIIGEDDDDEGPELNNSGGIEVHQTGDTVIGPIGQFVVLADTYTDTYYLNSDIIKFREITPEENAALRQYILDNNLDVSEHQIGWTVTGYYG